MEDPELDEEDKPFLNLDKASSSFDWLSVTNSCSWSVWVNSSNLCKYVFSISFNFLIKSTLLICLSFSKFFLISSNKPVRCLVTAAFALFRSKSISLFWWVAISSSIARLDFSIRAFTSSLLEALSNCVLYSDKVFWDANKRSPNQKAAGFNFVKRLFL